MEPRPTPQPMDPTWQRNLHTTTERVRNATVENALDDLLDPFGPVATHRRANRPYTTLLDHLFNMIENDNVPMAYAALDEVMEAHRLHTEYQRGLDALDAWDDGSDADHDEWGAA